MYTHVYLDAGHGDWDEVKEEYTTAPSKQFKHELGAFHNQGWFYEGVKNSEYINRIYQIIADRGNVTPVIVNHAWKDTTLGNRVAYANFGHTNIENKGIYFSEHSNATPEHTARGYSVWTSVGQTKSDKLADNLMKRYKKTFGSVDNVARVKSREDLSDGDSDYEANFYVLRNTHMPAVLAENLFFDQFDDAMILMNHDYRETYCEMVADWIEWSVDYLNKQQ
jgi:N-acetylmuramoyl-L-alanine amidase